ncbi:helix-turn-helix transcriptional regulator [Rhodopseudomonas palustris]|jgi:prophage regulatory protein|uniref:helix-turn-helix transcriptional regulator n=1 Tax=Rhodopseudomonas palustris TaxID=1076 RepID=UPI0034E97EF2
MAIPKQTLADGMDNRQDTADQPLVRFTPPESLSKRAIRRPELHRIVPLADTTIYEMEQRGEFPKRFFLTPRCVVWDLAEVEQWLEDRRLASMGSTTERTCGPDVRLRKTRPVRAKSRRA